MRTIILSFAVLILSFIQVNAQWYSQYEDTTLYFIGVSFINSNKGIVVGTSYDSTTTICHPSIIFKTTNAGANWGLDSFSTPAQLYTISSYDEENLVAVGDCGTIARTTDGGNSWREEESGILCTFSDVEYLDLNIQIAVGSGGVILKTSNSGNNWNQINSGTLESLSDMHFFNHNRGICVGWNGAIVITTDGGENWNSIVSGTNAHLISIDFFDSDKGIIVGSAGTVLYTSNGGLNWTMRNGPTDKFLSSFRYLSENTGIAVGEDGIIIKTTDNGITWEPQSSGTDKHLSEIFFVDELNGWIVSSDGIILHTTNGGSPTDQIKFSADSIYIPTEFYIDSITISNHSESDVRIDSIISSGAFYGYWGYLGNDNYDYTFYFSGSIPGSSGYPLGIDIYSADSIKFWIWSIDLCPICKKQPEEYFEDTLRFVFSFTDGINYSFSKIIPISGEGHPSDVNDAKNLPTEFMLEQNYPNPFNPNTTIKYSIPNVISTEGRNLFVTLNFYDVLGNEVTTLVNEDKPAGNYEVEFKSSVGSLQLASGVYYYQLRAGDFVETKKMILMK